MAGTDGTGAKVAIAVALTAALLSPRMRSVLRRGAVHGLTGALTAGDALASFARGVSRGMQAPDAAPADTPVNAAPAPATTAAGAATPTGGASAAKPPARRSRSTKPRATPAKSAAGAAKGRRE